ncbi:hypothetical protein [Metamycoplasma equirhinis]|uniref:hypothetical protein n=1 Tax=Metamycoplasma equirhinis TaxID=92402 RepID=UPI0035930957
MSSFLFYFFLAVSVYLDSLKGPKNKKISKLKKQFIENSKVFPCSTLSLNIKAYMLNNILKDNPDYIDEKSYDHFELLINYLSNNKNTKKIDIWKKEAEKRKTFVDYLLNYYYYYYLLDLKEIELDLSKCLYLINNIICYCTLLKRWLIIYTLRSFLIIQFAKFD